MTEHKLAFLMHSKFYEIFTNNFYKYLKRLRGDITQYYVDTSAFLQYTVHKKGNFNEILING